MIFFSGCPLRCLYCHNPDTWEMKGGRERTVADLLEEYEGIKTMIGNGGITATGGEPLMQLSFLTELFKEASKRGISTCLDTSGILYREEKKEEYEVLLKYTDLVMLDIKELDSKAHKNLTGSGNESVLAFLRVLEENSIPVWIRHVVVPGLTDSDKMHLELGRLLGKFRNIKALDVLPYHDMGKQKYKNLGIQYPLEDTEPARKEVALKARNLILKGMRETRKR